MKKHKYRQRLGRAAVFGFIVSLLAGRAVQAAEPGEAVQIMVTGKVQNPIAIVNERSPEYEEASVQQNADMQTFSNGSGTIAEGSLRYNEAYELQPELLDYTSVYTATRQYACEAAGGVYFYQRDQLLFLNLETGEYHTAYDFPTSSDCVYCADDIFYWAGGGQVIAYDLAAQEVKKTVTISDVSSSYGIGVDNAGRIYLGAYKTDGTYMLQLRSPDGVLLDEIETEGPIYEFSGFAADGCCYFVAYRNWLYWGYEHDMEALFAVRVQGDSFVRDGFGGSAIALIENVCQIYFSEYQDCARLLNDRYLADWMGNVFDVSGLGELSISLALTVSHPGDEEIVQGTDASDNRNLSLASIGTRMFFDEKDGSIVAYRSNKNICRYDPISGAVKGGHLSSHYVFNLLEYGDSMIAIEREAGRFYIELISKYDFGEMKTVTINLNEGDTYASHTREEVKQRWKESRISEGTPVYKSAYSFTPYQEAVYTEEMKTALLDYSNYLRWLGGLTPYTSAQDEIWSNAAKGALLLTKNGELSHSPTQPDDMDAAFFEAAYQGCSDSNIYGVGVAEGKANSAMSLLNGWLDDLNNVGSYELGHRFAFLQRGGYQLAYGSTESRMNQTNIAYGQQENTTGTIEGVANNDYCYTWPGAGYFPENVIDTRAYWSINLNSDMVRLSNEPLQIEITDLDTGVVQDVTDSIGSSAYLGLGSGYFDYFYGQCYYFDPPAADSYVGRRYQVRVSNLELLRGDPAEIVYTVNFIDADEDEYKKGDVNGDKKVDIQDLRLVLRYVCGKTKLSEQQIRIADVEKNDGKVDIQDLRKILRYVCKKINTL